MDTVMTVALYALAGALALASAWMSGLTVRNLAHQPV
jgi:hypothetical protein